MLIRRRKWVIVSIAVAGLLVAALVALASRVPFSSKVMRDKVTETLEAQLDASVELDDLSVRIYPRLHAEGRGLTIRHKRRSDVPPLIRIEQFDVDTDLLGMWRQHVAHVKLSGLVISVPPHDDEEENPRVVSLQGNRTERHGTDDQPGFASRIVIDELEAPQSRLVILRREPDKEPRTWSMHKLRLKHVGLQSAMPFDASLTNAVPPGQIETKGSFGPWNRREPGDTPLDGTFTFDDADLGVFHGISGKLSAKGTFQGSLERISVDGHTETPDFSVTLSGHKVPLTASYHAIVDGTNGNTTLDPVNATFLDTSVVARGGVYDVKGANGRNVVLDVTMDGGRLEDVMRMAVPTPKPPMSGALRLETKLAIPPGDIDVIRKLRLDGRFAIAHGRFTDPTVQRKINELSDKASAKGDDDRVDTVSSDFMGRFKMDRGVLSLPNVTFDVPGAVVELSGRYAMVTETIDFTGNLFMDAKISETQKGWKSIVLKMFDPLFRKNGKTVIPLKINGPRNDPHFGVDVKKVMTRDTPEAPKTTGTSGRGSKPEAQDKEKPAAPAKAAPGAKPTSAPKSDR
jgi:hypothetical protein